MSAARRLQRSGIADSPIDRIFRVERRIRPYKGDLHLCAECYIIGPLEWTDAEVSPNTTVMLKLVKNCKCPHRIASQGRPRSSR